MIAIWMNGEQDIQFTVVSAVYREFRHLFCLQFNLVLCPVVTFIYQTNLFILLQYYITVCRLDVIWCILVACFCLATMDFDV